MYEWRTETDGKKEVNREKSESLEVQAGGRAIARGRGGAPPLVGRRRNRNKNRRRKRRKKRTKKKRKESKKEEAEKPIVVRETKEICILSNCRFEVREHGGVKGEVGAARGCKVVKVCRAAKMEKGTNDGAARLGKGSDEVSSNSPVCCYLNPSRSVSSSWRSKAAPCRGISAHYFR